ncbi:hypothetical protein SAMN05216267_101362 [Actinacidiphila rubida]|uniref:Ava_C0101 and related proteins n=1 Tax=Actinacidiphila rubida TaxID=310780 RepID=A0A1H8KKL8_9ACTN|nr:DUF5996 family protein [Actinacidiphila rubida]SEN93424.1 hypothetical protein SAMN05216267_101362 [Actinacidiphila rubida]
MSQQPDRTEAGWPKLSVDDWSATRETLHMWAQIVGKVRLSHAPLINHWWQVPLYVSPRGLTTSAVPYRGGAFDLEFDFLDHRLVMRRDTGDVRTVRLEPKTVARFYDETLRALGELGIESEFQPRPNEVEPSIPFAEDDRHASYDAHAAELFWRQLLQGNRILGEFRARFAGKVSPVHLFWGAMDLACSRFSGRGAPPHPGGAPNVGAWVMEEAYSRELYSSGFWPNAGAEGAFYAYAYPEPDGFRDRSVLPAGDASYSSDEGEFLLPYDVVRTARDPDATVLEFFQTTYEAAADLGAWDRASLEVDPTRWSSQR